MRRVALLFAALVLCAAAGAQTPVSANLFGIGDNSPGIDPWCPTDGAGHVTASKFLRLWDSQVSWAQTETAANTFTWTALDRAVNTLAPNSGCPQKIIYTFGSTPQWAGTCAAAADPSICLSGPTGSGYGGGVQSSGNDYYNLPPSDVNADGTGTDAIFQGFVSPLANRYGAAIPYYEIRNEADSGNFWCAGAPATGCPSTAAAQAILVRMAWDARKIILCANSNAKILSPSFHANTGAWFTAYNNTSINAPAGNIGECSWSAQTVTGIMTYDIVNFHGYGQSGTNADPTKVIAAYNTAASVMATLGILNRPLWNDEFGCNFTAVCSNQDFEAAFIAIEYALMACFSNPQVVNADWFVWDGLSTALQGSEAGTAYDVMAGWLVGSTVGNYSISGTVYSILGTTAGGSSFKITFDTSQTCLTQGNCTTGNQSEAGYSIWTDLTGASHPVVSGVAPVGLQPIILFQPTNPAPAALSVFMPT